MRYAGKNKRVCADTIPGQFVIFPAIGIMRRREKWTFAIGFLWLNFGVCINCLQRRAKDAAD